MESLPGGIYELTLVGVAVAIGLIQLLLAAIAAQPQRGMAWNVGSREQPVVLTGMAGRLERAFTNFRETFPLFAAAVVIAYFLGDTGRLTAWGATLYVLGRAFYVPLYAFAITYVRSVVWFASFIGIVLIVLAIFL
jgi:uncharacterized MAPEG superfamily protein